MKHFGPLPAIVLLLAVLATSLVVDPAGAIVAGSRTRVQQHPWMVSLQDDGEHVCGASLITSTAVITAAHCTEDYFADEIEIVAGITRLDQTGQRRDVVEVVEHPAYFDRDGFDIAVVLFDPPIRTTRRVRPIRLARAIEVHRTDSATVTGWGARSETDELGSVRLRQATLPLVDDATCSVQLRNEGEFITPPSELCAGATGPDSCYGDSGGPLVIRNHRGKPRLAGVVSWGIECGGSTPGVYAEVAHFRAWIRSALS